MARPRRLYINSKGKYYYIIDGKKRFVKVPEGMSQKQVQTINIKNIITGQARRIKKRTGKKIIPKYEKKLTKGEDMTKVSSSTGGLPMYIFTPQKKFFSLGDIARKSEDTSDKKIIDLLEGATLFIEGIKKFALPAPEQKSELTGNVEKYMKTIADQRKALEEAKGTRNKENINVDTISESPPLPPPITMTGKTPQEALDETSTLAGSEAITATPAVKKKGRTPGTKISEGYALKKVDPIVKVLLELEKGGKEIKNITIGEANAKYKGKKTITSDELTKAKKEIIKQRKATPVSSVAPSQGVSESKTGFGEEGDNGLYNDQIQNIMKKRIKNFVPVVASDQVNSLLNHVGKGDKFFTAVINTDPSHKSGRHWTGIVMDNRDDYPSAEFFDSLAENDEPPEALLNVMKLIARKMNPEKYFKYKFNRLQRQNSKSTNCGMHVMKFIEDRYNGDSFEEASGWKSYMDRQRGKGIEDSKDGESELKPYEKKIKNLYKSYL